MASKYLVYALCDPRTGSPRYIGKSTTGLKRAYKHMEPASLKRYAKTYKACWIQSLLQQGLKPLVHTVKEYDNPYDLYKAEQEWIEFFLNIGCILTNGTDGGPGRIGHQLSKETKEKLRIAASKQKPVKHSTETKEKLRKLQLGRKHSLKSRINMSTAHGGRPFKISGTDRIFYTQTQAAKELGLRQVGIGRVLLGKRKSYKGFQFEYVKGE